MKRFAVSAVLVWFAASGVVAEETAITAGQRVEDPAWDFSWVVPKGWSGDKVPGKAVLTHGTLSGMILVSTHDYNSVDKMRAQASLGVEEDDLVLHTDSGVIESYEGIGLSALFEGAFEGRPVTAFAIALMSPRYGGPTIVAIAPAANFEQFHSNAVRSIAVSMEFDEPASKDSTGR